MATPNTIIIVGGEDGNQAKLQTLIKPVRLDRQVGLAITSICHGQVHNINDDNNRIIFYGKDREDECVLLIPVGYYPSTATVLRQMAQSFADMAWNGVDKPSLQVTQRRDDVFATAYNMTLQIQQASNTPWPFLGVSEQYAVITQFAIKNVIFEANFEPAFLYVNIVENSYINGKLSRVLSVIPISMKAHWSFYEFTHPNFVPIDVKEFSKLNLEIRDMNGRFVDFDSNFKTIITLQTKPINRHH